MAVEATALFFNVLTKKEEDYYLAHCLELDLVTTAPTIEQAREDIADVIACQVDDAFAHDNLDYLYPPAPPTVWAEFFSCRGQSDEIRRFIESSGGAVPPWIIAKTCQAAELYRV
jgi:hypothetical protein